MYIKGRTNKIHEDLEGEYKRKRRVKGGLGSKPLE